MINLFLYNLEDHQTARRAYKDSDYQVLEADLTGLSMPDILRLCNAAEMSAVATNGQLLGYGLISDTHLMDLQYEGGSALFSTDFDCPAQAFENTELAPFITELPQGETNEDS